jgi:hypothetical protein
MASSWIGPGSFGLVELRGLEPLTPCLQSDVYARCDGADLARQLSVSSREIPQPTPANGTLMARPVECLPDQGSLLETFGAGNLGHRCPGDDKVIV